ncbi:MAG: tetratricopeptide repeat protein [Deltaproteobacteria bacterium]|nr:tetratricopeptide repeat protein [Deltaproteobacteria bacterium]
MWRAPAVVAATLLGAASVQTLKDEIAARGVPRDAIVVAFEADGAIFRFAAQAAGTAGPVAPRAHKLYQALLGLKHKGAIAADRDNTPKARPPKTAIELLQIALDPGAAERKAGCYELSALYVAAARSVGLEAVGVERDEAAGTGQIGHVMAGVRVGAGAPLTLFDLQNETVGGKQMTHELGDLELAAHHYNHRAVAAHLGGRYREALAEIDRALALAPESASFRNNRATVLAALGEPALAAAEAAHAVERAPAVPLYRYQLGRLYLVQGELQTAATTLAAALALRPGYGLARRDLGWTYLLAGDVVASERELRRAVQDDPAAPEVELYLGLFLVSQRRDVEARAVATRALTRHPGEASLQALLQLAGGAPAADPKVLGRLRAVLENVGAAKAQVLTP